MITITDTAQEKIRTIIEGKRSEMPDLRGLRMGYQARNRYTMTLTDEEAIEGQDETFPFNGFEIIMDSDSAVKMEEASIDYIETPAESGFKIDNPLDNKPLSRFQPNPPTEGPEKELFDKVAALVEEAINPGIASHGGFINVLDVKGSTVYVEMGGGCQGCAMSQATLKQGVERTIRSQIPEIQQVLDVTDHADGTNPYYAQN